MSRADESNTEWLMAVMGAFYAVTMAVVCMRLYVRFVFAKNAAWDDYYMIMAAACSTFGIVTHALQAQNGLGKHYEFITRPQLTEFTKWQFFQSIITNTGGIFFLKVSIAFTLLKISDGRRLYTNVLYGFIAFTTATIIYAWGTLIFFCDPIKGYWDRTINATCYPIQLFVVFGLVHTGVNAFTDVAFAILPIPVIWVLQIKKRTKVYLCAILSLGLIAVIFGALKATYQIKHGGDQDRYFMHGVQFWAFLQLNTGIMAASAPMLKPLLGHTLKLTRNKTHGNSSGFSAGLGGESDRSKRKHAGYMNHTDQSDDVEMHDTRHLDGGRASFHADVVGGPEAWRGDVEDTPQGSLGRQRDAGSEEMIFRGREESVGYGGSRIIKTTEVSVK